MTEGEGGRSKSEAVGRPDRLGSHSGILFTETAFFEPLSASEMEKAK